MTTADDSQNEHESVGSDSNDFSETDDLLEELLRDVDTGVSDLQAQAEAARQDFTVATRTSNPDGDPIAASSRRYELVNQIATLRADVERQTAELDDRDRLLAELSNRIEDFEDQLRAAGEAERAATETRNQLHDERRELARVGALLEASAVERDELSDVAQRLKNERDHLDTLLTTALERFEDVDRVRTKLADDVAQLESARVDEAAAHERRLEQLTDAKSEVRRLGEMVDELSHARDEALRRADKVESKVERNANQVGYLNRRIETLNKRAGERDKLEAETSRLNEENARLRREVGDLRGELEDQLARAEASAAAVEAIADKSASHDDLMARIAELEGEVARRDRMNPTPEPKSELSELAQRARALGARRSSGDYAPLSSSGRHSGSPTGGQSVQPEPTVPPTRTSSSAVWSLDEPEFDQPTDQSSSPTPDPASSRDSAADLDSGSDMAADDVPAIVIPSSGDIANDLTEGSTSVDSARADSTGATFGGFDPGEFDTVVDGTTTEGFNLGSPRRRAVLPAEMAPGTTEAVRYLLSQSGVVAIVDARSFCAHTGVRPSELFTRVEALRDRFDVPVEVVVTPVSTPVGGAPHLLAIGVHHVGGADTVSDRIRALCMGFPPDQPIVVIAGDDHVRRAAIGEEANVVEPSIVLEVT